MKDFTISLTKEETLYIESISIDRTVDEFLEAFVRKNLFDATVLKELSKVDETARREEDEYDKVKNKMSNFGIVQSTITSYLKTSQSSVSYFFTHKPKKSHLYTALIVDKDIIFKLYIHQCNIDFEYFFSTSFKESSFKYLATNKEQEIFITALAVALKKGTKSTISDETIKDILFSMQEKIKSIDSSKIASKNIEYLYQQIEKILLVCTQTKLEIM